MKVAREGAALAHLAHINYYRLRAYWLHLEASPETEGQHNFQAGTSFEDVIALYDFDRRLRMFVLDAIERIEVSIRTNFALALSLKYGSHAHLRTELFADPGKYAEEMAELQHEIGRSHETFIKHYKEKYTDPADPPIWAITEVTSLGLLSRLYTNLAHRADRNQIAKPYDVDQAVLRSFLRHITHVRNICAHHCRLWNRRFVVTLKLPTQPPELSGWFNLAEKRRLYNTLVMLAYFLRKISPESSWVERLKELLASCHMVQPQAMGFPSNWQKQSLWQ
jgi:abortive infection bacteriophage resistance protein